MATVYTLQNNQLPTKVSFTAGVLRPEDLNLAQNLNLGVTSNSVSSLFAYGIVSASDPTLNLGSLAISFPSGVQSVQIDPGSAIFPDGVKYTQTITEIITLSQMTGVTNYVLTLAKDEIALTTRYNSLKDKIENHEIGYQFSIKLLSRDEYNGLTTEDLANYIFLGELVPSGTGFQILSVSNRPWFTTVDTEHRGHIGTGTVSDSNPHGMSLNDLNPLPGMTFWEQSNLLGVISNVKSANNRGDLVTQTITPQELVNNLYSHVSCRVATTGALSANYSNGFLGVGATLTNSSTQVALQIDGVALSVNDRVLIKDQAPAYQNGVYVVTNIGSTSSNWILTRATDFNSAAIINNGDLIEIVEGTENFESIWETSVPSTLTVGTSSITFSIFTGVAASGVSFIINRGAAYVLSVVDTSNGSNLNFTYNRATRTVTVYPGYVITDNLTVSAIVINIGTVTQKIGSGSILSIDPGITGEFLVSNSASISQINTTELNIQGLAGAVNEYTVYALNSGAVKVSPSPVVQTDLFQLQNTIQGTIYLPYTNFVNIALTNFKVPATFTLQLQIVGSGGTEIISISDPDTALEDTTYTAFTVPYATDLTTSGSEIKFFSSGTQWVKTTNEHSYISSISVLTATNVPTTLGFLITQDSSDVDTVNLATIKLSNKGNIYSIVDLREQKIFTEQPYDSIFFENFYNPVNFNPSISSSIINPALYKSTWYSRPLKLDPGIYRVVVAMDSIDMLPVVGYTNDFGGNITEFEDTGIYAGFNHKVYTFSLTQAEYVSLYISTESSKETKVQSISLDIIQTPVTVQFGMPTGVYEGFEPSIDGLNVILSPDTDSLRSLASLSYPTGTFYYQKNADVTVPIDARSGFDRIDLVALEYKDQNTIPRFMVFKGQSGDPANTEPALIDPTTSAPHPSYDSDYNYLILARVNVPSDSDIPLSVRNYSGNQGTGRNYRMSYFHSIAQEVEEARNNFTSLSEELSNTRNATILNSRSGVSYFTATASTSTTAELIDSYTIEVESGSTVEYDGTEKAFQLKSSGIYEIQAYVSADAPFSTSGAAEFLVFMNYYDGNDDPQDVLIDDAVGIFGETVYGIVQVQPEWSDVYVRFERLGTYAGVVRGSVKFLNDLPSTVEPSVGESLDGVPTIIEILLNGIASNNVTVSSGSSVTVSAKFNGTAALSGLNFNGVLSYGIPVVITPAAGSYTYTLSVTKSGRTISETFTVQATT